MTIDKKLIEELLKEHKTPEAIFGQGGLMKQLIKSFSEHVLQGEMTHHLGYQKNEPKAKSSGNSRNGTSPKTLHGEFGKLEIEVPRDRNCEFEPQFIQKGQRRFSGFDDKILSCYARGMSTRDIQSQLQDLYGIEISASLISTVADAVMEDVISWQSRPLDPVYPIIYLDALVVKIKKDKQISNHCIYLALGINLDGEKDLLGMWCHNTEGSKFWLSILTELKNRGLKDILICCCDGLAGFPSAIEAVYPQAKVQLCIVHLLRNSLRYVGWKDKKSLAADLKAIYRASTVEEAELALEAFAEKRDKQYPMISKMWRNNWMYVIPFFAYPPEIRKVIYTTNAIESLNMTLRKVIKNKRIFSSAESAFKLIYLCIQNVSKKWTMPIRDWKPALARFMIEFEGRI